MNTTLIALVIVSLLGVGVYIAVGNLAQQYAVVPGGSQAGQYVCAPALTQIKTNQPVRFTASLPEGTMYFWSAPEATASFVTSGPLTATYTVPGTKTAYLFYVADTKWFRTTCSVVVR
jgi:hypothetical protein